MSRLHVVAGIDDAVTELDEDITTDIRTGRTSSMSDDLSDLLSLVNAPPLDDAEAWAERDARVQAQREMAAGRDARDVLERRGAELVADHGFPERAMAMAVSGATKSMVLDAALSWRPTPAKSILILSGDQGVGKTVAACAYALQSPGSWRYVRAATYQGTSRFDRAARDRLLSGSLVLDDLGAEYVDEKGSFLADLDELIDHYYSRPSRTLVITTNVSSRTFSTRYRSARLLGRLREASVWREFGDAQCLRPAPRAAK